jgi:CheY-like chemotaxis protein
LARKILLADDSVTAQNMGRKILTDAGYEVVTVNNGSAALKKIAEGKPDLIVLDVYMPGYSGLEVCQRIKENRETARIPILLTVGKLEPFKPEEARRARADAFVVKPFEASELLSALTKLEDKIIPGAEPYKQGRFAKAIASVDQEPEGDRFGDSEGGWKARLRIPTGKPKEKVQEPDPDYAATQGKGFRDLGEPTAKRNPSPALAAASAVPERPPFPTGIPHDITPEEIAAITAAAAQLGGAVPPAVVERTEIHVPETATGESAPEPLSQDDGPVTFASSPSLAESEEAPADVQTSAVAPMNSPQPEPVAEAARIEPVAAPSVPVVEVAPETLSNSEIVAEAPSVTQSDERPVEAAPIPVAEVEAPSAVSHVIETHQVVSTEAPEAVSAPEAAPEIAASNAATASASDDEVMAALQTLIPASENTASYSTDSPSNELAEFPAHSAHPRWIAEEVGLATDEATISLEKEMAAAYSTFSGEAAHSAETASQESMVAPADSIATIPEAIAHPPVQALASAAAAGEGAPAYSSVSAQASAEPSTAEQPAEIPISISEGASVPASSIAEFAQEGTNTIEGEVMAASWKNIRDSIAGAAAKPALSKEEFREPEPTSGDHHVSPPAEQAAAQFKASDPTAIANIVDSVLAELRPKIVEEIARKLADSKKE